MSDQDEARKAAVQNTVDRIQPGMTIGLGSGRAVFALADAIGERWPNGAPINVVAASPQTTEHVKAADISVVELTDQTDIDIAFDGADEVDDDLAMIKGGGAALLTEKLVLASARHVVIMVEENKLVNRLGETRLLPVEIVRFGWSTTQQRVLKLTDSAELRTAADAGPVVTPEGNYLLDISVPPVSLTELATNLKLTLGVIEHGLFFDHADELIVGHPDGSIEVLRRS